MIELESGFRKGDINNIPTISNEMMCDFIGKMATGCKMPGKLQEDDAERTIDFVQVRTIAEMSEVRSIVFAEDIDATNVSVKVDKKNKTIVETGCEQCDNKEDACEHVLAFVFWLHRKSTDKGTSAIRDFWGAETVVKNEFIDGVRIRDIFGCDELRVENDFEAANMDDIEGQSFLDAMLNELENLGIRDAALYKHCRPVFEEFEPLFVHHALLDAQNNSIRDIRSFLQHMEDQAKQGLFDRLSDVTKTSYKTPLWIEVQYMRLRCSLIHRIAARKDTSEDEQILELLFCRDRELCMEERQQLKQHKRFILKQTEKLENKFYQECGLLLNESYPYICATPDGITDDHIVEIKAPKTEEDFEKYLEGRETIAPKYMAQIQIQMYMANVTKALYCVLSPTFDTNGALHYVWVQADMEFVASLLGAAEDFWKEVVFPRLAKIYIN